SQLPLQGNGTNIPSTTPALPSKDNITNGVKDIVNQWLPVVMNGADPLGKTIADNPLSNNNGSTIQGGLTPEQIQINKNKDAATLLQGVQSGDPALVNNFKDKVNANIDNQISELQKQLIPSKETPLFSTEDNQVHSVLSPETQQKISDLQK